MRAAWPTQNGYSSLLPLLRRSFARPAIRPSRSILEIGGQQADSLQEGIQQPRSPSKNDQFLSSSIAAALILENAHQKCPQFWGLG
jgi:hypothetical protein